MAMMTMLRNRMHVVLWALLVLFLLSMTVGGLVGGANIIDQLLGKVNPAEAIGLVNGQKITPNQFNQAVNAQMDAIRNSGSQISDQDLERVRSQVWNGFIEEYLTKEAIEDLDISVSDEEITCPNCGKNKAVKQLSAPAVAVGSSFEPACERTGCSTPVQSGFG